MNTNELERLAAEWAADDRKWNTQEVVEQNLLAFINIALAAERKLSCALDAESNQRYRKIRQLTEQLNHGN